MSINKGKQTHASRPSGQFFIDFIINSCLQQESPRILSQLVVSNAFGVPYQLQNGRLHRDMHHIWPGWRPPPFNQPKSRRVFCPSCYFCILQNDERCGLRWLTRQLHKLFKVVGRGFPGHVAFKISSLSSSSTSYLLLSTGSIRLHSTLNSPRQEAQFLALLHCWRFAWSFRDFFLVAQARVQMKACSSYTSAMSRAELKSAGCVFAIWHQNPWLNFGIRYLFGFSWDSLCLIIWLLDGHFWG